MSAYYVNLVAINPKREELRTPPVRVRVDTGSQMPKVECRVPNSRPGR